MISDLYNRKVIVLAPEWPGNTSGYAIAMRASLLLYLDYFTKVHFICISDQPFGEAKAWPVDRVEWIHIPIENSPIWVRFLYSIAGTLPAITVRYSSARKDVMCAVGNIVDESDDTLCLIFEDIPIACLMRNIVHKYSKIAVAVRSHNMSKNAVEDLCKVGTLIHRLAWKLEVGRIRRYEKNVCEEVDRLWTISQEDADEYVRQLSVQPDGVIGVCMDTERYQRVGMGDAKTVVNVGTADLRKGIGMSIFIQRVWRKVRTQVPDARLVLAGRGTECFTDAELGIEGLGFVDDDRDVLERGAIVINPQQIGTGIQLKSIVAMLSGKTLLSTPTGIEGVEGKNGEHFISVDPIEKMASEIVSLMQNPERVRIMGREAREFAMRTYSAKHFIEKTRSLLGDFTFSECKRRNN